jgi:ferric-dicitrate binding protein FerR (iron transport regulator)
MDPNEYKLLLRALDDALTPAEQDRMKLLLQVSPEVRAEWNAYQTLRNQLANEPVGDFPDTFVDRVMQNVPNSSMGMPPRSLHRPAQVLPLRWVVATGFVLLMGFGLAFWLQPRTIRVPNGEMAIHELEDGTRIELSSGSLISYAPFWGRNERLVKLEGEAFFDVTPSDKPFIVNTFNAQIEVKGTRFNVRAWPTDATRITAVSVESGLVEVTADTHPDQPVLLRPEQGTEVRADSTRPSNPAAFSLDYALAWRTGGLAFSDQVLPSVVAELERRFDIVMAPISPELAERRLTHYDLNPQSPEEVLTVICHALNLNFRRTAWGFELIQPTEP